jgi:uncharacterized protein YbaA (DUF1428 family)
MTYVEGFMLPVPRDKEADYRRHAAEAWAIFQDLGVRRQVEAWGDDVPDGKVTDFRKAVQAEEGETVVFAWFEYPDRAARDAANAAMMADPRMEEMGATMPFDGKRMVMGGFETMVDEGESGGGFIDGIVLPVPTGNREAYREMAQEFAGIFREYGALRVVENWGDDVPDGKHTDFRRAVVAEEGEQVVFSWIEWPSKETRDQGWGRIMADERMNPGRNACFDGKRMFWGGFRPIFDERAA